MDFSSISVRSCGHLTWADTQVRHINESLTRLSITLRENSKGLNERNCPTVLVRDLAYVSFCFGVSKVCLEPYLDRDGRLIVEDGDNMNNVINRNIYTMMKFLHVVMKSFAHIYPKCTSKYAKILRYAETQTNQIDLLLCWTIINRFEPSERDIAQSNLFPDMTDLVLIARNTSLLLDGIATQEVHDFVSNCSLELCRVV